nr:ubiquitin carboxyl-terminal hydrolase 8-like [Dermacentor andersoni]
MRQAPGAPRIPKLGRWDVISQLHRKLTFAPAGAGSPMDNLPPGLVNRGQNLCFAISSLQCLFRTPEMAGLLQDWVQNSNIIMAANEEDFLWSYLKLHVECVARNLQPSTQDNFFRLCRIFMPQLVSSSSYTQDQQDAAEFAMKLLNVLHKILNSRRPRNRAGQANGSASAEHNSENFQVSISTLNKRCVDRILEVAYKGWQAYERANDSPIVHLFTGQTSDITQCTSCLKTSIRTQEYNVLPIPIEPRDRRDSNGARTVVRLYDLLVSYTEAKRTDNRDANNENELQTGPICNLAAHTSWLHRTMISQAPPAIVLQLLRFQFDSAAGQTRKIRDPIKIPSANMCLPNGSGTWPQYKLYGIVAHIGTRSTQDGHYIAYAEDQAYGKWYRFDDEAVTPISDIDEELAKPFLMENAYLLFYKKT